MYIYIYVYAQYVCTCICVYIYIHINICIPYHPVGKPEGSDFEESSRCQHLLQDEEPVGRLV